MKNIFKRRTTEPDVPAKNAEAAPRPRADTGSNASFKPSHTSAAAALFAEEMNAASSFQAPHTSAATNLDPQVSTSMVSQDDSLNFLPPSRPSAATNQRPNYQPSTNVPTRSATSGNLGGDVGALPLPGAQAPSRLAGLFADDDSSGLQPTPPPPQAPTPASQAVTPPAAETKKQETKKPETKKQERSVWAGSGHLFRLDDDGAEMVEVDVGENRGGLVGVLVRIPRNSQASGELLVYTAGRKRSRLRCEVSTLQLVPLGPTGDSVSFYDEHSIYWAIQLDSPSDAGRLLRALLAVRALESGRTESVEIRQPPEPNTDSVEHVQKLPTHAAFLDLGGSGDAVEEIVPSLLQVPKSEAERRIAASFSPSVAEDASWHVRFGAGVGEAVSQLCAGAACLVAVPPPMVPAQLRRSDQVVLLVEVEASIPEVTQSTALAPAAVPTFNSADDGANSSPPNKSILERVARMGVPLGPSPPPAASGNEDRRGVEMPRNDGAGQLVGSPAAEIIRQYWATVQQSAPPGAAQFAYLGALPFAPGLTRVPQQRHQDTLQQERFQEQLQPQVWQREQPQELEHQHQELKFTTPYEAAADYSRSGYPKQQPSSAGRASSITPLGSLTLGELVGAMREVVRSEATPEGWQAERQKLERRVSMLEDQLRSARAQQEDLLESHKAQTTSLHSQLAEAQLAAHMSRDEQLRRDSERRLVDWQRDAANREMESELQQYRREVDQLRMEERSLRERLSNAEDARQRAEGVQAATASTLPELQVRLREQAETAAQLQRTIAALADSRLEDVATICKNALAIIYEAMHHVIPPFGDGSSVCVGAGAVVEQFKAVCLRCANAVEQKLQGCSLAHFPLAPDVTMPPPIAGQLDWDAVAGSVAEVLQPLPALEAAPSEAQQHSERLQNELEALLPELSQIRSQLVAEQQQRKRVEDNKKDVESELERLRIQHQSESSRRDGDLELRNASATAAVAAAEEIRCQVEAELAAERRASSAIAEERRLAIAERNAATAALEAMTEERRLVKAELEELRNLRSTMPSGGYPATEHFHIASFGSGEEQQSATAHVAAPATPMVEETIAEAAREWALHDHEDGGQIKEHMCITHVKAIAMEVSETGDREGDSSSVPNEVATATRSTLQADAPTTDVGVCGEGHQHYDSQEVVPGPEVPSSMPAAKVEVSSMRSRLFSDDESDAPPVGGASQAAAHETCTGRGHGLDTPEDVAAAGAQTRNEEEIARSEAEARAKVEEMANAIAEEEARLRDEEAKNVAKAKAGEEARLKAEEEARIKIEEEAKAKALEEEMNAKAEEEARLKAEEEVRIKTEEEAKAKALEEEAKAKVEEEARLKAEEEARRKAEEEEEEVKAKALEEEARARLEEDSKRATLSETPVAAPKAAEQRSRLFSDEEVDPFPSAVKTSGEKRPNGTKSLFDDDDDFPVQITATKDKKKVATKTSLFDDD